MKKHKASEKELTSLPAVPEAQWWIFKAEIKTLKILEWIKVEGRKVVEKIPIYEDITKKKKGQELKIVGYEWNDLDADLFNLKDLKTYCTYLWELDGEDSTVYFEQRHLLLNAYNKQRQSISISDQKKDIQESLFKVKKIADEMEEVTEKAKELSTEENKKKYAEKKKTLPKTKEPKVKGPSVTKTIEDYFLKGGTKEGCIKKLVEVFPDRNESSLKNTIGVQMSYHLKKKYNIIEKKGVYSLKEK